MNPLHPSSSVPVAQGHSHFLPPLDDKVRFLDRLNPFIQLLLAIGNAIFLPSCFVFTDFLQKLTAPRKLFFETLPTSSHSKPPVKKKIQRVQKSVAQGDLKGVSQPLKLQDVGVNCCYLDSALQALAAVGQIRKRVKKPLVPPPKDSATVAMQQEYENKVAIQKELIPFMEGSEDSSVNRLREAIFQSGLHTEFKMPEITNQHDAAEVMELMFNHLFPENRVKMQESTSVDELPGLEFVTNQVEVQPLLLVGFRGPGCLKLESFLDWVLWKHYERDERSFNPSTAKISHETKGPQSLASPTKTFNKYVKWYRLTELPPVLCLHLVRFSSKCGKNFRDVELPEDGIVDFEKYYDASQKGLKQTQYQIKSYVVHEGSTLVEGHYVAYVECNGKYYRCNDQNKNSFEEISEKVFFSQKDAYLIFLERLPEDIHPQGS